MFYYINIFPDPCAGDVNQDDRRENIDGPCGPGSIVNEWTTVSIHASFGWKFSHCILTFANYDSGGLSYSTSRVDAPSFTVQNVHLEDKQCDDPHSTFGYMGYSLDVYFVEAPEDSDSDSGSGSESSSESSSSESSSSESVFESSSSESNSSSSSEAPPEGPIVRDDASGCIVRAGHAIVRA